MKDLAAHLGFGVAVRLDELGAVGDGAPTGEGLGLLGLFLFQVSAPVNMTSHSHKGVTEEKQVKGGRTHVVAPPDGVVVGAAHAAAVSRARPVGRAPVEAAQVLDAVDDARVPGLGPVAVVRGAVEVGASCDGVAVLSRRKLGSGLCLGLDFSLGQEDVVLGEHAAHLGDDLLGRAVDAHDAALGRGELPLDFLDAVALDAVFSDDRVGGGLQMMC